MNDINSLIATTFFFYRWSVKFPSFSPRLCLSDHRGRRCLFDASFRRFAQRPEWIKPLIIISPRASLISLQQRPESISCSSPLSSSSFVCGRRRLINLSKISSKWTSSFSDLVIINGSGDVHSLIPWALGAELLMAPREEDPLIRARSRIQTHGRECLYIYL